MSTLLLLLCVSVPCVIGGPPGPRPQGGHEAKLTTSASPPVYPTTTESLLADSTISASPRVDAATNASPFASGERLPFELPPIPENARDVHEVRIVEFIHKPMDKAESNGTEGVDSRAGPSGPVLTPTDVRPQDSNLGVRGYHELLDELWIASNISRSCILYNNFDAIRSCDCQACVRAEPNFREKLCDFGAAVRNSSEIAEYVRRVMGPDVPAPSEVFMQEDYYKALCDEKRCPNVRNQCCNPAFNPGLSKQTTQQPQDFYQVDSNGCPACHPVVPIGVPMPSLDRSCILEEVFRFAPLPPLALPGQ